MHREDLDGVLKGQGVQGGLQKNGMLYVINFLARCYGSFEIHKVSHTVIF